MEILILGLVLFFGIHLVPVMTGMRSRLFGALGEKRYKSAFSLLSAIGLVLIVIGYARAPAEPSQWCPVGSRRVRRTTDSVTRPHWSGTSPTGSERRFSSRVSTAMAPCAWTISARSTSPSRSAVLVTHDTLGRSGGPSVTCAAAAPASPPSTTPASNRHPRICPRYRRDSSVAGA